MRSTDAPLLHLLTNIQLHILTVTTTNEAADFSTPLSQLRAQTKKNKGGETHPTAQTLKSLMWQTGCCSARYRLRAWLYIPLKCVLISVSGTTYHILQPAKTNFAVFSILVEHGQDNKLVMSITDHQSATLFIRNHSARRKTCLGMCTLLNRIEVPASCAVIHCYTRQYFNGNEGTPSSFLLASTSTNNGRMAAIFHRTNNKNSVGYSNRAKSNPRTYEAQTESTRMEFFVAVPVMSWRRKGLTTKKMVSYIFVSGVS